MAFVAVQIGELSDYFDYVAESAQWNEDFVDFFVFHVVEDEKQIPHLDPRDPSSPLVAEDAVGGALRRRWSDTTQNCTRSRCHCS